MGKPRSTKMTDDQRSALLVLLALGICGWGLVIELVAALEHKKLLTRKQGRRVVAEAANKVQELNDLGVHPALEIAISILRGELDGWEVPTE